ncbi:MAG: hypothetical protein LBE12_09940 [Planctomycetaceae bacterium]|jgi:hypothetical protein|nr:hypothetical protein [Planctomycetaceae bacterium]
MNTILPEPDIILDPPEVPEIPLPKNWMDYTLFAILHVIALVRIVIPISKDDMIHETKLFFDWYNEYRPHTTLNGKTPNEVYYHRHAANAKPRIETRPKVKHSTLCAKPRMCIADKIGTKIKLRLEFLEGQLYLPLIRIEQI